MKLQEQVSGILRYYLAITGALFLKINSVISQGKESARTILLLSNKFDPHNVSILF